MTLFSSTLQMQQWADAFLQGIPYARESGMKATSVDQGRATVSMPGHPDWTGDSLYQTIHPGCATVLADTACGVAVGTALAEMVPYATLDLRMDYLRPAQAGAGLVCVAHCHRISRNVAFVRGEVLQAGSDEPVAMVSATFMLATSNTRREPGASGAATTATARASTPDTSRSPAPAAPTSGTPEWLDGMTARPASPLGRSPYVDFLGLQRLVRDGDEGGALLRMPFKPVLIGNPVLPALHGGVVAGFAESAALLHLMATSDLPLEQPARGVDFSLDYLRPARPVDTFAHCSIVRQGARVALVHVQVWQDDPTRPIVSGRSHCLLPQL